MNADEIRTNFGKNIKKYRKSFKLTQEELAEKVGSDSPHITQLEKGRIFISCDMLAKMCNTFEILPNKLFEFTEPSVNSTTKENIDKINLVLKDFNNEELQKVLKLLNFIKSENIMQPGHQANKHNL